MAVHVTYKFHNQLPTLRQAINGETDLRTNQKLYKKVSKYYKDLGLKFTGDTQYDYETILDCLAEDIYS
jgi:hypothetical protein